MNKEFTDYEQISKWLQEYNKSKTKKFRARYKALIVTGMIPVIKRIARTIARRSYDPIEDMVQAGSMGLLKAIDCYSVKAGVEFRIYAGKYIIGEMKHFLRDKLNSIRVPRHIQELMYRINSFTSSLTPEELYDLTSTDVAEALNVSQKTVDFVLQADRRTSVISLEDLYSSEKDDSLGYEELFAKEDYKETSDIEDARLLLNDIIKKLPEDCRSVVELYYYRDMNQKEIAQELNLTAMSVSRKLKKSFSILSKMIASSDKEKIPFIKE